MTIGEVLHGRYEIREELGRGSFGQVVSAFDKASGKDPKDPAGLVAVKVIKSKEAFRKQAKTEVQLLQLLNSMDPQDQWGIVQLREVFDHGKHVCLVFEHLSFNLFDLLKRMKFSGVSLNLIRKFARQILKTLAFLSLPDIDVVHCDLKPENILVRQPARSAIKVIDFGSSCKRSKRMYSYIQSRFYRSPEVVLGLPYNQAIDMWSLGCILVELHTGVPLFAGRDEMDQMHRFVALKGLPPRHMLEQGRKTTQFFFKEKQTWEAIPEAVAPPGMDDGPPAAAAASSSAGGAVSADLFDVPGIPASAWAVGTPAAAPEDEAAAAPAPAAAAEAALEAAAVPSASPGSPALPTVPSAAPATSGAASRSMPSWTEAAAASSASAGGPSAAASAAAPSVRDEAALRAALGRRAVERFRRLREEGLPSTYSLKPRSERSGSSQEHSVASDLREVLGVHTHGPKGRRRDEATGHTVRHYELFLDLIERMLDWDPKKRIRPMQALNHPFLREEVDTPRTPSAADAAPAAAAVGPPRSTAASPAPFPAVPPAAGGAAAASASSAARTG